MKKYKRRQLQQQVLQHRLKKDCRIVSRLPNVYNKLRQRQARKCMYYINLHTNNCWLGTWHVKSRCSPGGAPASDLIGR